jgi:DNA polymerase III gamma/tau subunit
VLGGIDFSAVASFCDAALSGDAASAFERAEAFLAAGKSVGMLVKDVLNFLNVCAIAKICRDGKTLLALPEETYQEALQVARKADGHALLRATEIFAQTEQALKYATSPRILFETAVLKVSMPKQDYDIEALLTRIAALEKRLENGVVVQNVVVNDGGRVATNAPTTLQTQESKKVDKPQEEVEVETADIDVPPEMDVPPDEAETGGNVYFDNSYLSERKRVEQKVVEPAVVKPSATVVSNANKGNAQATFGAFLRSLRKTGKSGVVFAMCMDLESAYEGDVFVLYTDSPTIYNSLSKPEHTALLAQSFAGVGIAEGQYALRLRGKQADDFQKGVDEIKQTFSGVKIDVK